MRVADARETCGRLPPTPTRVGSGRVPTKTLPPGWRAPSRPGPVVCARSSEPAREIGRALAPKETDDSPRAFEQVLSALGFQPQLELEQGGRACCRLGNCPYTEAVVENQPVVCTLHKGLTAGLLEQLSPAARLTGFEPHDPVEAGCLIEVVNLAWAPETDSAGS